MKVAVVYKKSTYSLYSKSKDKQIIEYLSQGDHFDILNMKQGHLRQKESLKQIESILKKHQINYKLLYRRGLQNIETFDLIIVLGGDGTFLEVSHFISKTEVMGVNSDPQKSVGFFMSYTKESFENAIIHFKTLKRTQINRLTIKVNGQTLKESALNDVFFGHASPAATSRYKVNFNGKELTLKNSGVLLSTGAGSSGWMHNEGGILSNLNEKSIQVVFRGERQSKPFFVDKIEITSLTRQGAIYIDGPHLKHVFTLGNKAIFKIGNPLKVIGDLEHKRNNF